MQPSSIVSNAYAYTLLILIGIIILLVAPIDSPSTIYDTQDAEKIFKEWLHIKIETKFFGEKKKDAEEQDKTTHSIVENGTHQAVLFPSVILGFRGHDQLIFVRVGQVMKILLFRHFKNYRDGKPDGNFPTILLSGFPFRHFVNDP